MAPPPEPPSQAMTNWTTQRRTGLDKLDGQCVWAMGLRPEDGRMVGLHLRAYVSELSADFQGYCRDLYTEAAQCVVDRVRSVGLRSIVQAQFLSDIKLDRSNPTLDTLSDDFRRFGILDVRAAIGSGSPADAQKGLLKEMNRCRNQCVHGEPKIAGLTFSNIRAWRGACDWIVTRLNAIVYTQLRRAFRASPW